MKALESIFGRVAIPLMTPFTQSDEVDYKRARQLAERMIERNHCDSLIVAGTNGEFHALTFSERINLFKEIKQAVGNEVPLIAGTGATTTDETIQFTKQAEDMGYEAALILAPYYGIPTQNDLVEHFTTVAAQTALPIILYNIPIFTNANIEPETALKLAEIDNIVGIKEEAALMPLQTSEIMAKLPGDTDFAVYCGDDTMVLAVLAQGGSGSVSGGAHVTGDLLMTMIESFFAGRISEAIDLNQKIYKFARTLGIGNRINPVPMTKIALALTGFDVGIPRKPFLKPAPDEIEAMESVLREIGKL
jgi:4-hydroxy-tetrahydrodipicolinate synthase